MDEDKSNDTKLGVAIALGAGIGTALGVSFGAAFGSVALGAALLSIRTVE